MRTIFYVISVMVLTSFFLVSCNDRGDENLILNAEATRIDSVAVLHDTMLVFSTQSIKTFSKYRANCEGFYGYDYRYTSEFGRQIISYRFLTETPCGEETVRVSQINFRPQAAGNYHFRFWNGSNSNNENVWLEKTVVVLPQR